MRNITLSAQDDMIENARAFAARKHRTLNDLFREWLESISVGQNQANDTATRLNDLWQKNSYLRVGKRLTRDEMNEK